MAEKYSDEVALLVGQAGPLNNQRWALRKTMIVGREASCEIVVADRQVSRHHARFTVTSNGILLEDMGSKNGTYVNGQTIKEKVYLQDGDIVQIALAQKFIFLSSDATVPLDSQDTEIRPSPFAAAEAPPENSRLRLEKRSRRVWVNTGSEEKEITPPLSVSQFRLLELLYENNGRVVSRYDLVTAVWGEKQVYEISEQALDALVRRLRERIASIDPDTTYIITVRGHGLRMDNPPVQ